MIGQANILNKFAKIRLEDIRGLRVPFLKTGWNRQFLMMKEFGFIYESSIIAPLSNPPLWPFTLDYKIPFDCSGKMTFLWFSYSKVHIIVLDFLSPFLFVFNIYFLTLLEVIRKSEVIQLFKVSRHYAGLFQGFLTIYFLNCFKCTKYQFINIYLFR